MKQNISLMEQANAKAVERMYNAEPVLIDIRRAIDVVPDMTPETILTSGASLPWEEYFGGQRNAIIGGALFEGLASDAEEAEAKIRDGRIKLRPCHDYHVVGSITGVTTASMAVFVVENIKHGNRAFCTLFEGEKRERLTYGSYNEDVHKNLLFLRDVIGEVIGEAVRLSGGISLRTIMSRALHMGDELHSRNTAATFIFTRELVPYLIQLAKKMPEEKINQTVKYITENQYSFLRLSMASAKSIADSAHGIKGSSVVTYMGLSCLEYAIRVSGLGDDWFRAPIPKLKVKYFEGYSDKDQIYAGGESMLAETVGLGGLASAAAFPLQSYVLATPEEMVERTLQMYKITLGEHPVFKIPFLRYRGTPTAIEIHHVVETGITPIMDIGAAGKDGSQIGAGFLVAPISPFQDAVDAYAKRYSPSQETEVVR